ncbi:RbsD/FucU family protein [Planctomycetota bacterium]|nr:RbsD/FucU family protein [Planctomycetota bacterium]
MLKGDLIHADILHALGKAGHGSKILIADGNYPASTTLGKNARLVSLNLTPGCLDCVTVLEAITSAIVVEKASVMETLKEGPYAMIEDPEIWADFKATLKKSGYSDKLDLIERFAFYEAGASDDVALVIQTGEQRIYANILLTIGVRM